MINNIFKDRLILAYGLDEEELQKLNTKFNNICKGEVVEITSDMGNCTLEQILRGQDLKVSVKILPSEKVIIFNGFKGLYLQNGVKMVRETLGQDPILASTTPNSVKMSLHDLIDHLVQERELYKK